uniref:Apolipoprotein M n=1 Tax=Echeneis naucrates TaxID=173247 RepID=A0A665TR58_ECHNA
MSVQLCLALLALSALTAASDPDCEELIKPVVDRSGLYGRWIFYTGTTSNEDLLKGLQAINSSWLELSPIPDSADITLRWGDKIGGKCHYGETNGTVAELTKMTFNINNSTSEHVGKHLVTCPECLLWIDDSITTENGETKNAKNLYLFTKSGNLDDAHLEVFKKQVTCLNFQSEFHRTTTDLCPYEKEPATDVKEE